jgi:hypothetical protein
VMKSEQEGLSRRHWGLGEWGGFLAMVTRAKLSS